MLDFIIELITTPAIMLGLVALIGLMVQKKSFSDVVKGTIKTSIGLLILTGGAGIIVGYLTPFSEMFTAAFGLKGVVPFDEAVVGALSEKIPEIARNTSLILAIGFVINILLARITAFKYIFLTGHMMWILAGGLAWAFYDLGVSSFHAVLWGSIIQGAALVLLPALAQSTMKKLTGKDEFAYGHLTTIGVISSAWIGKLVGNPEKKAEDVKMPKGLEFFKDTAISVSVVMLVIYVITALFAGQKFVTTLSGDQNWLVFSFIQALGFAAGVLVLLQGVRMFLGEIIPAFRGVAVKLVPGARPALDVPVVFPYGPMALMIGFLTSVVGMIIGLFVASAVGSIIPLPSIIGGFFGGGVAGIFGNITGGRRGAAVAGAIYGLFLTVPVALFYPLFGLETYGVTGVAYLVPDGILILTLVNLFVKSGILEIAVIALIVGMVAYTFFYKRNTSGAMKTSA